MNPNKNITKGWTSFLRPLPFSFVVNESLAKCAKILQDKHELHFIGPSHAVRIEISTEKVYKFSIDQPRRNIPIKAIGYLSGISDHSTQITGEISADFMFFNLLIVFAVCIVALAVLSGSSGVVCFGSLMLLILAIGITVELIGQHYAKLGLFTFIKRAFEFEGKSPNQPNLR